MNYQASDAVITQVANTIAKSLLASNISLKSKHNDFTKSFLSLYWRNYKSLGLCNRQAVFNKTKAICR